MFITSLANSRWGPSLGLGIVRLLPRRVAYRLGSLVASYLTLNRNDPLIQGIRANQAVVRGMDYDDPELDYAVKEVLKSTAKSFVDIFKAIQGGEKSLHEVCDFDEDLQQKVDVWVQEDRGHVVVGPHMMGFDIFSLYLGLFGFPLIALSYPNPRESYLVQNEIRRKFGLEIIPATVEALRIALKHLRQGGAIITGVDRPGLGGDTLEFFGRKAILPTGHARLARRTGSLLIVGVPEYLDDGSYLARCGTVLEPDLSLDEHEDAQRMAQESLKILEANIRRFPGRWLMFYPVWPEVIPDHT
ncbi:MAG: hypothetical protein GTO18_03070 [Anaerolineales bacterium]|nr:hypothetical protein [Anaerolineales bacterium]